MAKMTKEIASSSSIHLQDDIDKDEYELWMEEADLNNIVSIEDIPPFNEPFGKLIKEVIKCNDAFMEILRVEGHIFSYEKFVSTMGGGPTYIFSVFGVPLIEKHRMFFLNAWMFASYLREKPMTNKDGYFDMDLFLKIEWVEHFRTKRRERQALFIKDFGMRKGYEANLRKQYGDDISKASPSSQNAKSTGQEPPEAKTARNSGASKASKETNSPIKERRLKNEDFDEEPPPPSSHDEDSEENSHGDGLSVPSQVQPRKLYDSSSDESSSDDSKGVSRQISKKRQKKKTKKKSNKVVPKSKTPVADDKRSTSRHKKTAS
jgi:hypothetical protein